MVLDRGKSDYLASHDLEDFTTVVDARAAIVKEVEEAQPKVRDYVKFAARRLLELPSFLDTLPGHLPPDTASQKRFPIILKGCGDWQTE
jgi:3-methyladenine DNA glycosylase/8-oxoguanine DNA glycosylase